MGSFTATALSPESAVSNPTKHVLYQLGMVLGVDDFKQEFAYHHTRDKMLARELAGYGTATGLVVKTENSARGWRIVVEPGIAVAPDGELIRICSSQCAYIDPFLLDQREAVDRARSGNNLRLY